MTSPVDDEISRILAGLDPEERELALKVLAEEGQGRTETAKQLMEAVYEYPICPMEEFIFSAQYLNLPKRDIYPAILELLILADDPTIREIDIVAGKGSGKSTLTSIMMARSIYRVMSYRDPSAYFGVLPGSQIGIVNMSISADQAENVIFDKFWRVIERAQFLNPSGIPLYHKRKRHIEFPKNMHAISGHSGYQAYFGYDVYFGALDECAWYRDTDDHPVSDEIYAGISGSCQTRYPNDYKILCISTPQAEDDFLYKRFISAKVNGDKVLFAAGNNDSDLRIMSP